MNNHSHHALILAGMICFAGCHKTGPSDAHTGRAIEDYMPLRAGHSITYQLDSIVYTHFGSILERHSYIVKDIIEDQVTDALSRPSWRMVRFYRANIDTTVWQPGGTSMITPLSSTIEVVENNLRYVKLCMPVQDVYSWAGNGYLPFRPYSFVYDFAHSDHTQLDRWQYIYQDLDKKDTINQLAFDSTITVACSRPDSSNFPPTDPGATGSKMIWVERYAKGVGLVYKDVVLQEYQPATVSVPTAYYTGFELKMSIIAYQ